MVSRVLTVTLRGLQFVWTLLVMALDGNIIATAVTGNPSSINYTIFVAVFSMLTLLYLIPATLKPDFLSFLPFQMVVLDALNTLFFFCAAVALSAFLGAHSCGNIVSITFVWRYGFANHIRIVDLYAHESYHKWITG